MAWLLPRVRSCNKGPLMRDSPQVCVRRQATEHPMSDMALAMPEVSANDTIRTTGILHFTIGVRDHVAAAKFYSEVLGCKLMRTSTRYAFMQCGNSYFVLAKMPNHVNPNAPGDDGHHHAFMVEPEEFDRALAIMKARGVEMIKYSDQG